MSHNYVIYIIILQDNLVNIGTIDCEASAKLCKEVGYSDDLVYFRGDVGPKKGEVNSY